MSANTGTTGAACTAWDNSECQGTPYCPPRCPRFEGKDDTLFLARPYESDDRDALVSMYADLDQYSRSMGLPPATVPKIEDWLGRLHSNGWSLIALDGNRAIGHVAVVPADSSEPEFLIFVHQAYQNHGIGTELIKQLVAYADDRDHSGLTLEVSKGNKRAITVYENVGFDVTKRKLSELEMELDLEHSLVRRLRRPPADRV
ncbi:GNAT family N-acetyltransferase [Haloterrigena sp. SYSU A121-1]|uniref:GNAT family N-acetyltransferase n=1 Tax=Haloterrigena gelatinilytica TaxID=2741724 RepID=A0A8J8KDR0_9EURY|nr:GNAT family N-acetyltransferase [Haloterrigena gelatinilytica]NUB93790.1 GNAT family N-acetyltransferase [Haloterrigena gelatinilytica]